MNKLLLLCLLSILILYTQCSACTDATKGTNTDAGEVASCTGLAVDTTKSSSCVDHDTETNKCQEVPKCKFATQGTATADKSHVADCKKLVTSDSNKFTCAKNSDSDECTEVEKPATNSGSILNAFKISFALIIIFAIL